MIYYNVTDDFSEALQTNFDPLLFSRKFKVIYIQHIHIQPDHRPNR